MKRQKKTIKLFLILFLVILFGYSVRRIYRPNFQATRKFTAQELSAYNGDDPQVPVYLALDGLVYDVSAGRNEYYDPGKSYHYLAGRDSSVDLHQAGGGIIKMKYPVIGTLISP